jgi:hypothetical protein
MAYLFERFMKSGNDICKVAHTNNKMILSVVVDHYRGVRLWISWWVAFWDTVTGSPGR